MVSKYPKITLFGIIIVMLFIPGLAQAAEDNSPPQVTSFDVNPAEINTENEDQQVTITMTLTDSGAGVSTHWDRGDHFSGTTGVNFWPEASYDQIVYFDLVRTSGDEFNGTYTATGTFPKGSMKGGWYPSLSVVDKIGNFRHIGRDELEPKSATGSVTVTNIAAHEDSTPPEITAFQFTPSEINTENEAQNVTLTISLTDDQAGADGAIVYLNPDAGGTQYAYFDFTRIAGTDRDGVYSATATLPKGSMQGTWSSPQIFLRDKLGNTRFISKAVLESRFGAGCATIKNNASFSDVTPPQIKAFTLGPPQINTDNQSQDVTLTVTITDDWAGAAIKAFSIKPLIGTQEVWFDLKRVSGDDLNGVYTATATLPKGSKVGVWSFGRIYIWDNVRNGREFFAEDMYALSPNGEGLTIVNTAEAESVTIDRDWTISTPRASVTFPSGTVVTKKDGGSFAFYKIAGRELSIEELPTENLEGTPVAALKFGIPGLNLSFSKDVSITFDVDPKYNGFNLLVQSLVEGGDAWVNEESAQVNDGKVTFTVNHATRFTANVVDKIKPSASVSSPALSTMISKTPTFKVNWSGSDPKPTLGIASFDVRYKVNSRGTWTRWKTKTTAGSAYFKGAPGRTYFFQARAKDKSENIGAWSAEKRTIIPHDNIALIDSRKGFNGVYKSLSSKFYLGTTRFSLKKGHRLVYKFTGKSVALVTTKDKNRSKAKIYIDGQYVKTVDAHSRVSQFRRVVFSKTWKKPGTHYIKIVNLATPGRPRFDIDGLAVGR